MVRAPCPAAGRLPWLLFFSALAFVSPTLNDAEIQLLFALALLQVLEPRIGVLDTSKGRFHVHPPETPHGLPAHRGLRRPQQQLLSHPAASRSFRCHYDGVSGNGNSYDCSQSGVCFLSPIRRLEQFLHSCPRTHAELSLRVLFLCLIAYLTYQQGEANRGQARRYQSVAEQLAEANKSLQEAEAAIRRSERLAALGQLTAGLAHELRNPLGTMKASAEVLRNQVSGENEVARELAGFIGTEVDRTNNLITRFPRLRPSAAAQA